MRVPTCALVLFALACARAVTTCPEQCACAAGDGDDEYTCAAGDATFTVKAMFNDYARITCDKGDLDPAKMPFISLSRNGTLASVGLRGCALPRTFASLLARLGARGARRVVISAPRGDFAPELAVGLEATEMLMITEAGGLTSVPWALLGALPALTDLRIKDADITLHEPTAEEVSRTPPLALRLFELSLSGVASLPPRAFARLPNITKLHLFGNKIQNISREAFIGLDNVQSLDLSQNPLSSLPARALSSMPRLRRLTLVAANISIIETDAFADLTQLDTVVVKLNRAMLRFGPRALSAAALRVLRVTRCRLLPLPHDLFHGAQALEEINITLSGLTSVPATLFRDQRALRRLSLAGNALTALPPAALWPLTSLEELDLDDNQIVELPGLLVSALPRLVVFSAERNALRSVSRQALAGAASLQRVSLAHNRLTLDPQEEGMPSYFDLELTSPFAKLDQLQELVLRGNRIRRMFSDWVYHVPHLRLLDLSQNNFTELTQGDVGFLGTNLTVDLRQNRIASVDLGPALRGLPPATDAGNVLLLDHNPFSCDCDLYVFIERLQGVRPTVTEPRLEPGDASCVSPPSLAGRRVRTLRPADITCPLPDQYCPDNCTCVLRPAETSIELDCAEQPAQYPFPPELATHNTHLRLRTPITALPDHVTVLNMTAAGLKTPPTTQQLNRVSTLDLSNNQLQYVPLELLSSNMTLYLAGNPFLCDCSHQEEINSLQKYEDRVRDADGVVCSTGGSVWNVDTERLCDVRRAALLGGTLAALGIIAAALAALVYRYTLEIKLFLFSKGWFRSLIHEEELDKAAQYDAFVSFSQEDAKWVSEKLVPMLEGEYGFKLCVHYRDWVVGDMIPAQIARSVEQSRRTIIVLSKSFLKSTWAAMEFHVANVRAQVEKRARVLVVVLDDVPALDEMHEELRAYVTTNTYLKWGDPWFWEKLRFAMPHRRGFDSQSDGCKVKRSGLNARLDPDGVIVNDAALSSLNSY